MPKYTLPFPGRELAEQELSYDPCYAKIPPEHRTHIVEQAWNKGAAAAEDVFARYGGEEDFFAIAEQSGLTCTKLEKDYVVGDRRYFSDYLSGQNKINLYLGSIALWADQNELTLQAAENIILSHEYFHFLEWNTLGLTSRDYKVPMLVLGPLKIGRTGVRALSEIGAHAFARTYYELKNKREEKQ
ncbi:hypothetical protein [Hydrogenoanaerobacterium sp.]|uniref:hypothetical protein n=1 Tax=Hydrogenoanaerobacterium sp. TaxID=2953763 RepID=UPI00289992E3|nr:hypothetical protein [Hydrogenoanaerobacterium sp.]